MAKISSGSRNLFKEILLPKRNILGCARFIRHYECIFKALIKKNPNKSLKFKNQNISISYITVVCQELLGLLLYQVIFICVINFFSKMNILI